MAREYYSIPEAASLLGISRIAVFKRVKKGRLQAMRFGRNWAVPAAALEGLVSPPVPAAARPAPKPAPRAPAGPAPADSEMDSMGWD